MIGSCGHGTPFDSSSHAYHSDSTEFHKGEGFQVKRKILYVFFKAFFYFWRLHEIVNHN